MTTLRDVAEMGYFCGLDTLAESVLQAQCHWDAYPPGALEELDREIEAAFEYEVGLDTLCVHFLGEERCREIDAEVDAYFSQRQDNGPGFDGMNQEG